MKTRFILIFTLFVYLIFSTFTSAAASSNQLQEIRDIAVAVKSEGLTIENWQVLWKEDISQARAEELFKWIESNNANATYKEVNLGKIKKLIWQPHKMDGIDETYILVIPTTGNYDYQLLYKLNGFKWNKKMAVKLTNKVASTIDHLFTENKTKFSCLNTQPSGNINSDILFKNLTKKWNVQPLTKIQEDDFVVLSGYTSHWRTVIPTADKPMNVQIAAREGLGGKTTLTIGTPIIVTEY